MDTCYIVMITKGWIHVMVSSMDSRRVVLLISAAIGSLDSWLWTASFMVVDRVIHGCGPHHSWLWTASFMVVDRIIHGCGPHHSWLWTASFMVVDRVIHGCGPRHSWWQFIIFISEQNNSSNLLYIAFVYSQNKR